MKFRCWILPVFFLSAMRTAQSAEVRETPTGTWSQIYSPDISLYAANLRAAGAPQATVGVLVSQEINARFKEREQALEPSLSSLQTLKEGWSAERREALIQIKREKNELLRSVLGAVPVETAKSTSIPSSLGGVTPEQRENIRLIIEDYNAMSARVYSESRGYLLEEDKAKLSFLEDELTADLVKVVGTDHALDYQIERDWYMREMRERLELFKPTIQELRDIYTRRRDLGLDVESQNATPSNRPAELLKTLNEKLAASWGPQRYAEYRRKGATQYKEVYHLARRLGLPASVAEQIYDSQLAMIESAMRQMDELNTGQPRMYGPGNPPPNPALILKNLMEKHCALAKKLLGDAGYTEYYQANSMMIETMYHGGIFTGEIGF